MKLKITIEGLVQGIGYRPFVARKAEELNITGWVRNTCGIVTVVAQGDEPALRQFVLMLEKETPPGGYVLNVRVENVECDNYDSFIIEESDIDDHAKAPLIPIDLPTCPECERELFDKNNRRYRHPFISCVNCGPRYTIIEELPYDRPRIVLKKFPMCPKCKEEYTAKPDRRRHAQTISCKECGPVLTYTEYIDGKAEVITSLVSREDGIAEPSVLVSREDRIEGPSVLVSREDGAEGHSALGQESDGIEGPSVFEQAIDRAAKALKEGKIVAIKDLGGYHLACMPQDREALMLLRQLKHRQSKPFAVAFFDINSVRKYCQVSEQEENLLTSPARPIVLLQCLNNGVTFSEELCKNSTAIGAMLCNNPVQLMLTKELGPLVMTSGNVSGDLLYTDNEGMERMLIEASKEEQFSGRLGLLSHDRDILVPMDDSITRVIEGRSLLSRRARGYAPSPIATELSDGIFAAGGDLKASFLYTRDKRAYISTQFGDLEDKDCIYYYKSERKRMSDLFGLKAKSIVCDKHPGYESTKEAKAFARENNIPLTMVQHHKAHVASVICEHGLKGRVMGVAFDGTGYGDDGTMWGSEFFLFDNESPIKRVGSLKTFSLPKGDDAARKCQLPLLSLMAATGGRSQNDDALNLKLDLTNKLISQGFNRIESTSMGRFFDGISCALGFGQFNSYEGEAACNLEYAASIAMEKIENGEMSNFERSNEKRCHDETANNELSDEIICHDETANNELRDENRDQELTIDIIDNDEMLIGDYSKLLNAVLINCNSDLEFRQLLALKVHDALAEYILNMALIQRERCGVNQVALSGGTFFNRILTQRTILKLENSGFRVYINEKVPCGDGGLCLGQAYMADHNLT